MLPKLLRRIGSHSADLHVASYISNRLSLCKLSFHPAATGLASPPTGRRPLLQSRRARWPIKVAGVPLAQSCWLPRRELPPCAGEASPIARFAARPAKARYQAANCRSVCAVVLGSQLEICRLRGYDDHAALATAARFARPPCLVGFRVGICDAHQRAVVGRSAGAAEEIAEDMVGLNRHAALGVAQHRRRQRRGG